MRLTEPFLAAVFSVARIPASSTVLAASGRLDRFRTLPVAHSGAMCRRAIRAPDQGAGPGSTRVSEDQARAKVALALRRPSPWRGAAVWMSRAVASGSHPRYASFLDL